MTDCREDVLKMMLNMLTRAVVGNIAENIRAFDASILKMIMAVR